MKHAMQKVLSLVLVAMLLVSAVPFQASASETGRISLIFFNPEGKAVTDVWGQTEETMTDPAGSTIDLAQFLEGKYPHVNFEWKHGSVDVTSVTLGSSDIEIIISARTVVNTIYFVDQNGNTTTNKYNETSIKIDQPYGAVIDLGQWFNGEALSINGSPANSYTMGENGKTVTVTVQKLNVDTVAPPQTTSYNVKFYNADGNCHWNIDVPAGSNINTAQQNTATKITYAEQNVGTKSGYTFSGWKINNTGNVLSTATVAGLTINANTSVYPVFTQNSTSTGTTTYKVQFYDVNGYGHWSIDVPAGSTIYVAQQQQNTATDISYAEAHVGTKSGYTFSGWKINNQGTVLSTASVAQLAINAATSVYPVFTQNSTSSDGTTSKFPYSVYLHIYSWGSVGSPMRTVTLDTWSCVKDGVISRSEVEDVVKTYYTAKTSDGIKYDGIYYSTSTTKTDYIKDQNKTDRVEDLDALRAQGYVHLNVWIDNYVAKTSTSTNPKTGDTIGITVAALGVTASALAAVYYVSKKRAIR